MHAGARTTAASEHFSAPHNAFYSSVRELFTPLGSSRKDYFPGGCKRHESSVKWLSGGLVAAIRRAAPGFAQGFTLAGEVELYSNVLLRCDSVAAKNARVRASQAEGGGFALDESGMY